MRKQRRRRRFRKWLILPLFILLYVLTANGIHPLADIPLPSFGSEVRVTANEDHGWNLILVNRDHLIPDDYEAELTELSNGQKVDSRIYPDLQDMFDEARSQGYGLFVASGYRTAQKQQQLLDEKTEAYENEGHSRSEARRLAEQWVAVPGTSEHQLGLAVDINADTAYSTSEEVYAWLDENAWRYGFIKRYPADKTSITGTIYEPWHYRYVGAEAAREIYSQGICLEEYIEILEETE